jgi:hypothetical protein
VKFFLRKKFSVSENSLYCKQPVLGAAKSEGKECRDAFAARAQQTDRMRAN